MANKKNGKSNGDLIVVDQDIVQEILDTAKDYAQSDRRVYDESLRGACIDRALEVYGATPGKGLDVTNVIDAATKIYEFVSGGGGKSGERTTFSGDASGLTRTSKP